MSGPSAHSRCSDIVRYSFEDADRHVYGSFTTYDYKEAETYAIANGLAIISNTYEWADSELVADYSEAASNGQGEAA